MSCFGSIGDVENALRWLYIMRDEMGVQLNEHVFTTLISIHARVDDFDGVVGYLKVVPITYN